MCHRSAVRQPLALAALVALLLGACAERPAAVTTPAPATAAPATPTPAPPSDTATPPPLSATATAAPPTPAPEPTAAPPTPAAFAAPTATPPFPEARVDAANAASLRLLRTIGFGGARDAAFAPDGRALAVATTAGVALFELPGLRHLRFDPIPGGATRIAFSDDGAELLVTTGSFFEPRNDERRQLADGALIASAPASFQPKALVISSPAGDVEARFYPPDSVPTPGVTLVRLGGAETEIYRDETAERIAFSADGDSAAIVGFDGTVRLLALATGATRDIELPALASVAFTPDAQQIVAAGRALWRWDAVSGALLQRVDGTELMGDSAMTSLGQRLRFSADGQVLTVAGEYATFEATLVSAGAWRLGDAGFEPRWESSAGGTGIMNFTTYVGALSPASDAAASTDDGRELAVARGRAELWRTTAPAQITALAFSPDGALLSIGDAQGAVRLARVDDGAELRVLQIGAPVSEIVFRADGATLAAQAADGAVSVWDVAAADRLALVVPAPLHPDAPASDQIGLSPDGELLLVWGAAGVRLHQLSDGAEIHRIDVAAADVAVGPRRRLLALLVDGQIQLWGIPI